MPAKSPEDICRLFQQAMAEGDLESVLSVYDPEAVFLNQSGEVTKSREDETGAGPDRGHEDSLRFRHQASRPG